MHNNGANVWQFSGFRNKQGKHAAKEFCFMRVPNLFRLSLKVLGCKSYAGERTSDLGGFDFSLTLDWIFLTAPERSFKYLGI